MINIALPKGRLGEKVYAALAAAGYGCKEYSPSSRKLVFRDDQSGVSYFWVKPSDVAVYVELGAADVGVLGKDLIDEMQPDVYELLDLKLGTCRMCIAALKDFEDNFVRPLRVATKFVRSAEKYFSSVGREIEIIHLNGSIELAPVLGLSDVIFDLVETGKTLTENNLKIVRQVSAISARLIANKSSYQFGRKEIDRLTERLKGG